jgi:hypothetical protein
MPAQTTNLLLLEDLEDVGRTSELGESDRDALHAVADWIKTYVGQAAQGSRPRWARLSLRAWGLGT